MPVKPVLDRGVMGGYKARPFKPTHKTEFTRETYLSAKQNCSQTPPWIPCPYGNSRWSQSDCCAPCKGPQGSLRVRLIAPSAWRRTSLFLRCLNAPIFCASIAGRNMSRPVSSCAHYPSSMPPKAVASAIPLPPNAAMQWFATAPSVACAP